jgi:hypothetical protein
MKNPTNKIVNAINIIRKFNQNINVHRTEQAEMVFLFDYTGQKKTIGSPAINAAVLKAVKQQDWPADVIYNGGCLTFITPKIEEVVPAEIIAEPETVETSQELGQLESEPETKKRGRKPKNIDNDLSE